MTAGFSTRGGLRCICGFRPGTGADTMVRFLAERIEPLIDRPVLVENIEDRPGDFEGNVATEHAAGAEPDGRTIYITPGAILAANAHLLRSPAVDVGSALRVFGTVTRPPNTLLVSADSPYETIEDLTAALQAKGSKGVFGVPNGSVVRVIAAMFVKMTGLASIELIYPASTEVVRDLLAGTIDFGFSNNAYSAEQVRLGNVRILAISLPQRLQTAPQFPTFTEFGYPIAVDGWWAGFVPSATPPVLVAELETVLRTVVSATETRAFLNAAVCDPWIQTADQGQAHFQRQIVEWGEHVRDAEVAPQQQRPMLHQPRNAADR